MNQPTGTAETRPDTGAVYPLSATQEFLALFDQGPDQGPFSDRYNLVVGWRLHGRIDPELLRQALGDVVRRHDALRATIESDGDTRFQRVHDVGEVRLEIRELGADHDGAAEQFLIDVEAGDYSVRDLPHLRACLGRFGSDDAVLALIVHHTASDGWSMQILIREFALAYAVRCGYAAHDDRLPASYQEYVAEQVGSGGDPAARTALEYWRRQLTGATMLPVTTDFARSEERPKHSPVLRFSIGAEVTSQLMEFGRINRCSPFMVLAAVYNVVLHHTTGSGDITIATLTSGRRDPRFHDTVGPFFNFVPLRTDLRRARTFHDVVQRTRASCIEAMSHELSFLEVLAQAPDLMAPLAGDRCAAAAFQVWQFPSVMDDVQIGDVQITEMRRRLRPQPEGTDIPDGALLTLDLDPSGEIFGNLAYNSNLYAETTMVALIGAYCRVLANGVADPDAQLATL